MNHSGMNEHVSEETPRFMSTIRIINEQCGKSAACSSTIILYWVSSREKNIESVIQLIESVNYVIYFSITANL